MDIVGMQSRVEELEQLLVLDSNDDVRVLGVCGMGGVGKTTLANSLFIKISNQFDVLCFIDDVSKKFRKQGPMEVQKEILRQVLDEENLQLHHLAMATNLIQTSLDHKKALIVLDNVDEWEKLDKLAIQRESLHSGSRIVIISRDEHILRQYPVDEVYKVQPMHGQDALQLFCRKTFKSDAIMDGYVDLTNEVLQYVRGLPLAINVLGSFLFGRDVSEWRSVLVRLRNNPHRDIIDVLRISFDALKDTEKEIFLDISCFFDGKPKEYVIKILDIRGFYPEIGMKVLIDKSLLVLNEFGRIRMHDLLKELGKSIVREISPEEPRKWSRLWDYMDFHNVMLENMATDNLEAIVIETYDHEFLERANALSKMSHLKLLILKNVNFSGSLNHLSNELGYLHWKNYPFNYLPSSFQPNKLVELIMPHSSIVNLWEDLKEPLYNLRCLDLSHSESLIKKPDFWKVPNLEFLNFEGCKKLSRKRKGLELEFVEKIIVAELVWRLVGLASSVVGMLCHALSPSFRHLIRGWNFLKLFFYCVFFLVVCVSIFFGKQFSLLRQYVLLRNCVIFAVLIIISVYSFLYDRAVNGKPEIKSLVANAAFVVTSLSLSKLIKSGYEIGMFAYFLGCFTIQLLTINWALILVAIIFGCPLFLMHSSSDSHRADGNGGRVGSADQHHVVDIHSS